MLQLPPISSFRQLCRGAAVLGLFLAWPGPVRAIDLPDFGNPLFDPDGVFLAGDERSSLLESLAAIASNFPGNSRVDDDLREKALALALRLDPLHVHSRLALRELAIAAKPKPTPYFDSLPSVSETLWSIGRRLTEPPLDPEERRLAPYLLELSLLIHPAPPVDRLAEFARVCGNGAPDWEAALGRQKETNASTSRARDLLAEGRQLRREQRRAELAAKPARSPGPGSDSGPGPGPGPGPPPGIPPRKPPVPVETVTASLASVRLVTEFESAPLAGTVTLTIREPQGGIERDRLSERIALGDPLVLVPSDEGIPLLPATVPKEAVAGRSWSWPEGAVGEVRFDPLVPPIGPRRRVQSTALLPALVLAEAALKRMAPNESFVLLGEIDAVTGEVSIPGELLATLAEARALNRPYFLVPSSTLEVLVADLQRTHRLEPLFQYELVSYADLSGAITRLTSPTDPALVAASADFDKIEAAAATVPLPELARLPSAQERLRAILASCPDHLSARAMLEYGEMPLTEEMRISQFAARLETLVAPFADLDTSNGTGFDLAGTLSETKSQFLKLRAETPTGARNLLVAAEGLVDAADLYLQLTNKGTSIAEQRLRETREAIDAYRAERTKLGLASSDD